MMTGVVGIFVWVVAYDIYALRTGKVPTISTVAGRHPVTTVTLGTYLLAHLCLGNQSWCPLILKKADLISHLARKIERKVEVVIAPTTT